MLNLVVGPEDWPAAVLIRGVEGVSGPGRLTKGLGIGRELNGAAANEAAGLWLEDRGVRVAPGEVVVTPRVGVDFAGPVWAGKKWRFIFIRRQRDEAQIGRPEVKPSRGKLSAGGR